MPKRTQVTSIVCGAEAARTNLGQDSEKASSRGIPDSIAGDVTVLNRTAEKWERLKQGIHADVAGGSVRERTLNIASHRGMAGLRASLKSTLCGISPNSDDMKRLRRPVGDLPREGGDKLKAKLEQLLLIDETADEMFSQEWKVYRNLRGLSAAVFDNVNPNVKDDLLLARENKLLSVKKYWRKEGCGKVAKAKNRKLIRQIVFSALLHHGYATAKAVKQQLTRACETAERGGENSRRAKTVTTELSVIMAEINKGSLAAKALGDSNLLPNLGTRPPEAVNTGVGKMLSKSPRRGPKEAVTGTKTAKVTVAPRQPPNGTSFKKSSNGRGAAGQVRDTRGGITQAGLGKRHVAPGQKSQIGSDRAPGWIRLEKQDRKLCGKHAISAYSSLRNPHGNGKKLQLSQKELSEVSTKLVDSPYSPYRRDRKRMEHAGSGYTATTMQRAMAAQGVFTDYEEFGLPVTSGNGLSPVERERVETEFMTEKQRNKYKRWWTSKTEAEQMLNEAVERHNRKKLKDFFCERIAPTFGDFEPGTNRFILGVGERYENGGYHWVTFLSEKDPVTGTEKWYLADSTRPHPVAMDPIEYILKSNKWGHRMVQMIFQHKPQLERGDALVDDAVLFLDETQNEKFFYRIPETEEETVKQVRADLKDIKQKLADRTPFDDADRERIGAIAETAERWQGTPLPFTQYELNWLSDAAAFLMQKCDGHDQHNLGSPAAASQ